MAETGTTQDARVRLVYLQRANVDHSMGRYVYPLEQGGVDEARESFWAGSDQVSDTFTFKLRLRSAYPVDAVRVTNGQASVSRLDSGEWEVLIESQSGSGAVQGAGLSNTEISSRLTADDVQLSTNTPIVNGSHLNNRSSKAAYSLDRDIVVYWRLAETCRVLWIL